MSLPEPSEDWRRWTRGVVWAGVVTPVPFEAALSWRVRGPGALRRLRVLLRRDLRRRCVGGGCSGCLLSANSTKVKCHSDAGQCHADFGKHENCSQKSIQASMP